MGRFTPSRRANTAGHSRSDLEDIVLGLCLTAAVAFIFYRSVFGLLTGVFLVPLFVRLRRRERRGRREEEILTQFRSAMNVVAGSLLAGYSAEGAWAEAEKEITKLYGKEAAVVREFRMMNHKIRMNEPIEKLFMEFAQRTGIEDICNFAEIFLYAKRSSGNMTEIIRMTLQRMREKAEIMEDIRTAVTAKKFEQRMLMLLMPGVLLFITLGSPEYVQSLYHTAAGVLVMTLCLAAYLFSWWWSHKIMDIQV